MKKILIIIALSSLTLSAFARSEDDGFITYRKPLLPGLSLTQTDDTTSIIYRGRAIKTYQNKEFAIELLPHGPNEDPDCYNSLKRDIPATRAKNIIGKDYLRSCFILRSEVIRGRYILLYSPSVEGNRVSIYDIRAKKYYHHILNTVLSYVMARDRTLIFLSGNSQSPCERSLVAFRGGETKMLLDGCSLTKSG